MSKVMPDTSLHPNSLFAKRNQPSNQSQVLFMYEDHQLQTNYGLGPLEVLSLLSFQYVHKGSLPDLTWILAAYCNSVYFILWAVSGGSCASASDGWYLYGHGSCLPTACIPFFEGRILLKYLFTCLCSLLGSEPQKCRSPELWLLNPLLHCRKLHHIIDICKKD